MSEGTDTPYIPTIRETLLIVKVCLYLMFTEILRGIWHEVRCETLGRDWNWEKREVVIAGDSIGEFDHCSECGASRPHPGGM